MDSSTPEGKIVAVLKQELKSKGLHYRDIAERLRVSESTVKRYLTGKDISLADLRKLAEIADLDLPSLVSLADRQAATERRFTKPQQVALARNKFITVILFLLSHGWTAAQIRTEFDLTDDLDAALEKLESLGLIRRMSHGIKLIVMPSWEDQRGGQMVEFAIDHARQFLSEFNLRDAQCEWLFTAARLSSASAARLKVIIKKFVEETHALTIADSAMPKEKVQWYRLFLAAEPTSRKTILRRR